MAVFKILSLDGGGSWAIIQLLALKDRYGNIPGREILKDFDLVIANSGGSIVLATLAENWYPDKALTLFRDRKTRESITYDALNNRAKFFRSYDAAADDYDSVKLTQAVHGSSNAPVQYFDFPARFRARKSRIFYELWDGALGGFNNPVLAGIIEAHKAGVDLNDIRMVSLGTSNKLMSPEAKKEFWDIEHDTIKNRRRKLAFRKFGCQCRFFKEIVFNQASTILYEPPDWANYVAMMFLRIRPGSEVRDQFIRLSPLIYIDSSVKDEVKKLIHDLYKLDMDLTKDEDIDKLTTCFEEWKKGNILNQPLDFTVKRDNDIVYKSGDRLYQAGMDRWRSW